MFAVSLTGIVLFLAGVLLEITISGGIIWGDIETRLYTSQTGDGSLAMKCPLVISAHETATISTLITNSLDEEVKPVIVTSISQTAAPRNSERLWSWLHTNPKH